MQKYIAFKRKLEWICGNSRMGADGATRLPAAYLFYFWLLRYLPASQLSAFSYLLPVMATILGTWWLGEKGTWPQFGGGALVLAGVYWIESGRDLEPGSEGTRKPYTKEVLTHDCCRCTVARSLSRGLFPSFF